MQIKYTHVYVKQATSVDLIGGKERKSVCVCVTSDNDVCLLKKHLGLTAHQWEFGFLRD